MKTQVDMRQCQDLVKKWLTALGIESVSLATHMCAVLCPWKPVGTTRYLSLTIALVVDLEDQPLSLVL